MSDRRRSKGISVRPRLTAFVSALSCLNPMAAKAAPVTDQIEVVGERANQVRREAETYLNEVGIQNSGDPAARWFDPVCPHAIGLNPSNSRIVEDQLRKIIADVGAPLAGPKCSPNLNVVFTDSGERVVQQVARHDSRVFQLPAAASRELTTGGAPIRWWYNSEIRGADGRPATSVPFPPGWQVDGANHPVEMRPSRRGALYGYNSSAVGSQWVRAIRFATVVVDIRRTEGLSLSSAVDYAALTGLAEVKLGAAPRRSILSLFEAGGEQHLTKRDRTFLSSLYRITMDRHPRQQRHALLAQMTQASRD